MLFNLNPKLSWTIDVDNRRFFDPDVENQIISHTRLHYKHKRWDFGAGLTYSAAFASIPENGYKHSMSELRPVIEASYEFPVKTSTISQRLRMDNRFFQEVPEVSLFDDYYYVMRWRYRLQWKLPLKRNEENITTVALRVADEIMVNDRKNFFDQHRIYLSSDFYLSKRFTLEGGYIYIYQQRYGKEEFFSRHVFRLALVHRIKLK